MKHESLIIEFIKFYPDRWREELAKKKISIKDDSGLTIFNYDFLADFSDPIVCEARGIIIDVKNLQVVCWPFSKFFNSHEQWAAKIDWSSARVQEKIDGSIVKYFWNPYMNQWQWATNSVINAKDANANSLSGQSFLDIIKKCDNYDYISQKNVFLDRNYTYIFELVSPYNQVVIKYPLPHLYHIGTKSNFSGMELSMSIDVERPQEYSLHSLEECLEAVKKLNTTDVPIHEGFVVVDKYWNRIKIKSPEYLLLHHTINNQNISKERMIDIVADKEVDIRKTCEEFPAYAVYFKYYDFKYEEIRNEMKAFMAMSRKLYEEYDGDRKALAKAIANHKYAFVGFLAVDRTEDEDYIFENLIQRKRLVKLIPDYILPSLELDL